MKKNNELILNNNLTQTDLAQQSGLAKRTIISYETGKSYPKKRDVYKLLVKIFGVELNYLLTEDDEFIIAAEEKYGNRGMKQAEMFVDDITNLFAGVDLSDDDLDGIMRTIQDSYWIAKEKTKKFSKK